MADAGKGESSLLRVQKKTRGRNNRRRQEPLSICWPSTKRRLFFFRANQLVPFPRHTFRQRLGSGTRGAWEQMRSSTFPGSSCSCSASLAFPVRTPCGEMALFLPTLPPVVRHPWEAQQSCLDLAVPASVAGHLVGRSAPANGAGRT